MTEKEQIVVDSAREDDGEKRLSCKQALELASRHDFATAEIGKICNRNGIKIHACQLGCFR